MKTLAKHTMVYDADCPLCAAYTKAFITTQLLDKDGRVAFQQVGGSFCPGMDEDRSKNEIALVNLETGEVRYGLDSLLTIIGNRFRWIETIARTQPLHFLLRKLYNFISYNRKVIAPVGGVRTSVLTPQPLVTYDCTPTFKLKYRIAYILIAWLLTSLTLVEYSNLLGGLIPATNFFREFLVCGGQVIFQAAAVSMVTRTRHWDYLGNMMTVSLFGAILLVPALLIGNLLPGVPAVVWLLYFAAVVGVMFFEHARRMKLLELGWWPSVSWVLYRMLVLVIIMNPL